MLSMSLKLPKPISTYLAAVDAKDANMLALCFSGDAWCMTKVGSIAGSTL